MPGLNVLFGIILFLSITVPFVAAAGQINAKSVNKTSGTPATIHYQQVFFDTQNELSFKIVMDRLGYNQNKMIALCFPSSDATVRHLDFRNICPISSRILIDGMNCYGKSQLVRCTNNYLYPYHTMPIYIKINPDDTAFATIGTNNGYIELFPISKFRGVKQFVKVAVFSVLVDPLPPSCDLIPPNPMCIQKTDHLQILSGRLTVIGKNPQISKVFTPPSYTQATTTKKSSGSGGGASSARFPYEILIVLAVLLILVAGIICGIKLVTKKWPWQFCRCCKKKTPEDEAGGRLRPRPADGSDEDKRSVSGDPKVLDGSASTNPPGPSAPVPSETPGPEPAESSDVKVSFAPGSKEQGGAKQAATQLTPAMIPAESPAAPPQPVLVNVPPPPPAPEAMKKKKKNKMPGTKESSSTTTSGTTATTTVDTKDKGATKEAPKAPNLIVVSKAEDLDGPDAKNKNKVQKNYNDVRQPTMTQDPTAMGRPATVRNKTKVPLATGKPTPTALGTARPNDKMNTQLATGIVKQETDLNDPTPNAKKDENAGGEGGEGGTLPVAETQLEQGDDAMTGRKATTAVHTGRGGTLVATGVPGAEGGTLQVAETQLEQGDDAMTGRGATTVVNTGRGATLVATGRPGTVVNTGRNRTMLATGRQGTIVATGRTATVMGSQGTQAGTDIDGEHQPGELVPVNFMTAAGTRPTQAATITKTRGVSGTQPGEEATDVVTGRGRTTMTKGVSGTQGTKITEGYETRPTQVESRETAAGTLRTGKGRTQRTTGLLTAGTQAASGGTVGTQGTQDPTMLTGRTQTRITGATQMPSSIDEGETQMPTGGAAGVTGGRTGTTQMLTQTTQGGGGGGTTVTRGGTRTTQAATRARTQNTQGGTTGGTQGTQEPTAFNFATGKTQTYATGATQMPSSGGETGETQMPTKTLGGRTGTTQGGKTRTTQGFTGTTQGFTGTTQGFTGTTQAYTKTQTVGARTSATQGGSGGNTAATQAGGGTAATQGGTATTQGGAGTATTQKRTSRGTAE